MQRLIDLAGMCKGSVNVNINPHRDRYQDVTEYLYHEDISEDIRRECILRDTVVQIDFYPTTPLRELEVVIHYDLEAATQEALAFWLDGHPGAK